MIKFQVRPPLIVIWIKFQVIYSPLIEILILGAASPYFIKILLDVYNNYGLEYYRKLLQIFMKETNF